MSSTEDAQPANSSAAAMPPPPLPKTAANASSVQSESSSALTADEIAQYDRQLRLWGSEAQERIRKANILLVSLRALGTEIAKNLTLAGVRSLNVIDTDPVLEEDLGAQYFVRESDIGQQRAKAAVPRIQDLNPRVAVTSFGTLDDLLTPGATDFTRYQCVIACDLDYTILSILNNHCHFSGTPFYAAALHGFYGFIFADLVSHEYKINRVKSNIATQIGAETATRNVVSVSSKKEADGKMMEVVTKRETYCPLMLANSSPLPMDIASNRRRLKQVPALLPCLRAIFEFQQTWNRLPSPQQPQDLAMYTSTAQQKSRELQLPSETLSADFLRSFIQSLGAEIISTAAVVGGRLSEDVINVLGKREQPIQNLVLFDGESLDGKMYCFYSPPPEMALPADTNAFNDADFQMNGLDTVSGLMPMAVGATGSGIIANGSMNPSITTGSGAGLPLGAETGMAMTSNEMQMPLPSTFTNGPANTLGLEGFINTGDTIGLQAGGPSESQPAVPTSASVSNADAPPGEGESLQQGITPKDSGQ